MAEARIKATIRNADPEHPDFGYLNGIPARSLTEDEFDALSDDDRERVEASGLWKIRQERAEPKPASKKSASRSRARSKASPKASADAAPSRADAADQQAANPEGGEG